MEYKFVVGGAENDYYEAAYADVKRDSEAVYVDTLIPFKSGLINFVYNHHFGVRISRIVNLPGKSLWNRFYLKNDFSRDDKVCFVLFTRYLPLVRYGLLKYLRKHYPKCKIVLFYQDLAAKVKGMDPNRVSDCFDLVLSFDQDDCKRYGWQYYPLVYSKIDVPENSGIPRSDVYFVGKAKDRLADILSAYEQLRDHGYVCDFHIVGVKPSERRFESEIDYCDQLPYMENLQRIAKTNCMLEIMQKGGHGYTLRYCEAIAYGKKLLTDNPEVSTAPFFSKDRISVFTKPSDMDLSILDSVGDVDYHFVENISPMRMLEFIDGKLTGLC